MSQVECPHCNQSFEVNPASLMGKVKSEAKTIAARENAKKKRPGRKAKEVLK